MTTDRPRFSTVLFDLDGTVADTLSLIYEAFNDALIPEIGRRLSNRKIRELFGPPDHEMIRGIVPPANADLVFARYLSTYERRHKELVTVFDGIPDLLSDLHLAGVQLGIVTGKSRVTALYTLDQLGLRELIGVVYAGDDVLRPKPDPEPILLALQALGHVRGEPAAFGGDSAADIIAGKGAGITTIGVLWGSPDHDELIAEAPDVISSSTGELRIALGLTG